MLAKLGSSVVTVPHSLFQILISSVFSKIDGFLKTLWVCDWYGSSLYSLPRSCLLKDIELSPLTPIVHSLNPSFRRLLSRIRTQTLPLKTFCFKFNFASSALCDCCLEDETFLHYLVSCPLWTKQRRLYLRNMVDYPEVLLSDPSYAGDIYRYVYFTKPVLISQSFVGI